MEKPKLPNELSLFKKIGEYKGYAVYIRGLVPKEAVANMMRTEQNLVICIRPDAYEILKARPDYLEHIYAHELQHNTTKEGAEHGQNQDIEVLKFLKNNGYDFGDFKFE